MSFLFLFCSFLLIIHSLGADLKTCAPSTTISHPANLNDSWYWPDGWNSSQVDVPRFATGQDCVWKFNVPKGMYAYFGADFSRSDSETVLKLTDSIGTVFTLSSSNMNYPYFLVDPSFTVELVSAGIGNLGMRVAWFNLPQSTPKVLNVKPNDASLALVGDTFNNATTIQAQTRVSLVSIKPIQAESDDVPSMRLTLVFDGPSTDSKFLGSLWQIMLSGNQTVSSGSSITLLSVWPGTNLGNYAIVQDFQNVKGYSNYGGISSYLNSAFQFKLDARDGPAAAIRYLPFPQYLTALDITQNAQVSVYSGAVNSNTLAAKYNYYTSSRSVPQAFYSSLTTYTLDIGVGAFNVSGRGDQSNWSQIFNNRQLVLSSPNLGVSSASQTFSESFSGSDTYKIHFNASNPGLTDAATLTVAVYQDKTRVVYNTYSSTSLPNATNVFEGNHISVIYDTNGAATTGCHLELAFETKGATVAGLITVLIMVLVNLW